MASPAAVLTILVNANTKQAMASLAKTDAALKKSATTAEATSSRMGRAVATTAKVGGLAIAGIGAASVKAAVDFESSFAEVRKTVDANNKQFKQLEDGIRSLAKTIPVSTTELNNLAGQAGALGVARKDLIAFTKTAAELGIATDMSSENAANALARLTNIMGTSSKDFRRLGSTFVKLGNDGASTEQEIADMALRIAGAGKQVGLTEAQVLSFSSALASVGIEAQAGGSAISRTFITMAEAVNEGGSQLSEFAKVAGMSSKGFAKTFEDDAAGAMLAFMNGLDGIRKSGGDVFGTLKGLELNEIRVRDALLRASGAGKLFNDQLKVGSQEWERNSALTKEANERYKTTAAQWQLLKNRANDLLISIGQQLLPELKAMMRILGNPKLTLDEKVAKLGKRLGKIIEEWAPRIAEAGAKLGIALAKGLVKAFIEAPILGKLFMGAAALRLFGGPGIFGNLGRKMGSKAAEAMAKRMPVSLASSLKSVGGWGPVGLVLGGLLAAAWLGAESKLGKAVQSTIKKHLGVTQYTDWLRENAEKLSDTQLANALRVAEQSGDKINNTLLRMWLKSGQISEAGAQRIREVQRKTTNAIGDQWVAAAQRTAKARDGMNKSSDKLARNTQRDQFRMIDVLNKGEEKGRKYAGGMNKNFGKVSRDSGRMSNNASGSFANLSNAASDALKVLGDNTNSALKALSVKDAIKFSIKKAKAATKAVKDLPGFQRGGPINLGAPSGDTVPAMLERGEYVLNRKAVQTIGEKRLNEINFSHAPRFQKGGSAKGGMAAMMALANKYERQSFPYLWGGGHSGFVNASSPVDCSGAVSDILHAGGLLQGAPMVSGALMNWGKPAKGTEPVVVYANPVHTVMSLNGRVFGTSGTNPGGGAGWIEGGNGSALAPGAKRTMDVAGFANRIARVLLEGPNGPLKEIGQSALDKTRKAANKFIASKQPMGLGGGGNWGPIGKMKRYTASVFGGADGTSGAGGYLPGHNSFAELSNDWQNGVNADFSALGGLPMHSLLRIAYRNKSLVAEKRDVGAGGPGIGGTKRAIDLYSDTAAKLGFSGLDIVEAAPISRQRGGIVSYLAKGGKPGKGKRRGKKGGFDHRIIPGRVSHGSSTGAQAQKQRRDLAAWMNNIANLDEQIQIAETLHGLESSAFGSALSPSELTVEKTLNTHLLGSLQAANRVAKSGRRNLQTAIGLARTNKDRKSLRGQLSHFTDAITAFEGITGRGGRIFDTQVKLASLAVGEDPNAPQKPDPLDISGLASIIEAAKLNAFAGGFAKGGHIPAGQWGITGERGPEIVHGPATVTPLSGSGVTVNVRNEISWEGYEMVIDTFIDEKLSKRERHDMALSRAGAGGNLSVMGGVK